MTHLFTVEPTEFENLQGQQRHLIVKDSAKIATGDTALVEATGEQREQLSFKIVSVEHGPVSKRVNSHYAILGLYAPYHTIDDIPSTVGGAPGQQ